MAVLDNTVLTTDVAPEISIDIVSNLASNIRSLQELLGIMEMTPVPAGTSLKVYKTNAGELNPQSEEGDIIPLSEATITEVPTTINFDLYRKLVTAQAIQKSGRERAIYDTDRALIAKIRGAIKGDFYTAINAGQGTTPAGNTLQKVLANAWASLHTYYEDMDASPVHFVNPSDVADYLGTANITTQNAFGFDYVEDFLGLGTVVFAPKVTAKTVISTAKENLRGAYIPANGEVGTEFELTADESGLVGVTHARNLERGGIESMFMAGVKFFAEDITGVFKGTIGA